MLRLTSFHTNYSIMTIIESRSPHYQQMILFPDIKEVSSSWGTLTDSFYIPNALDSNWNQMNPIIKRMCFNYLTLGIVLAAFNEEALASSGHCSLRFDGRECPKSTLTTPCSKDIDPWQVQLVSIRPTPTSSLRTHPEHNIVTILNSNSWNCWDIAIEYIAEPNSTTLTVAAFCNDRHVIFINILHKLESIDPRSCVEVITKGIRPTLPCSPLGKTFRYEFSAGIYFFVDTIFGSLLMVKPGLTFMDIDVEHRHRFEGSFGILEADFKVNDSNRSQCMCEIHDGYFDWIRNCSSFYDDAFDFGSNRYMKSGHDRKRILNETKKHLHSREDLKFYALAVVMILVLIVGILIIFVVQCMNMTV